MDKNNMFKGGLLVLIAAVAWGAMFPIGKDILGSMDGIYMTAIRYSIASLIFLAILYLVEGKDSFKLEGNGLKVFFFGSMGFAGFSILAFVGLSSSTPEHGAIIMALMPLITVIINMILRKNSPDTVTIACIGAALIGVIMVVTKGDMTTVVKGGSLISDLMILGGATCWVIYTMGAASVKDWSPLRYTALSSTLGTMITTMMVTFIATWAGYISMPSLSAVLLVWPDIAYMVIIAGVVAVLSWNSGIKILGPINGILFINLVPVTAFTIGIFQGHQFTAIEITGAIITIGALIASNINARRISIKTREGIISANKVNSG